MALIKEIHKALQLEGAGMIVHAVFHIYECRKLNGYRFLDGRLLQDIRLSDECIVLETVDINYYNRNRDKNGLLRISDTMPYEVVRINKIFSYGNNWESLPAGMSARLECYCSIKDLKDLLLCKIEKQVKGNGGT